MTTQPLVGVPSDYPLEQQIEAFQIYFDALAEGGANAAKRGVRRARIKYPWFRDPKRLGWGAAEAAQQFIGDGRVIVGRTFEPSGRAQKIIEFWATHGVSPAPRLGLRSEKGALGDHLFKDRPLPPWFAETIARERAQAVR